MTEKKATLKVEGQDLDLPIYTPTLGRDVIDVSKLVANGVFTFDPGFTSTASCESKITFIDGEVGKLLHRGYSIEDTGDDLIMVIDPEDRRVAKDIVHRLKAVAPQEFLRQYGLHKRSCALPRCNDIAASLDPALQLTR